MATEKRLIDANQLKTDMYLLARLGDNENIFIDVIIDEIDNADDVNAVEVVHGRWEDAYCGEYVNPRYRCSVCKEKALFKSERDELGSYRNVQALTPFCPYCMAKLDGEDNG